MFAERPVFENPSEGGLGQPESPASQACRKVGVPEPFAST